MQYLRYLSILCYAIFAVVFKPECCNVATVRHLHNMFLVPQQVRNPSADRRRCAFSETEEGKDHRKHGALTRNCLHGHRSAGRAHELGADR